jgi:microcystin degradation protein MlrC
MNLLRYSLLALLLVHTMPAAGTKPAPRIAVLRFYHETPTFLPIETTREDFIYPGSPAKGEALLNSDPKDEMGGFVKVAREYGAELIGIESPGMPKTRTGSGWVTNDAFEHFVGRMIAQLRAERPFDGVYLCVHGAMAVRGISRPEAELAKRVRGVVGDKTIIAGTFDPHGNEDDTFLKHADLAFAYKYYPHYDMHLQGERAARTMIRCIRGDYKPAHAVRKVPILTATVFQWTGQHPWSTLVQRCLTWEAREPDLYVNFFYGFPWSDVPDLGMCFQVISNNDPSLAERVADDLKQTAWRMREEMFASTPLHPVGKAMDLLSDAVKQGKLPAVLADYSDRSGNATWILNEVVRRDVARCLIATVRDDKVLQALAMSGAKAGDAFDMDVGGYMDESAGRPVRVSGTLDFFKASSDAGSGRAHVRFGKGNVLVISQNLVQVTEPQTFSTWGLKVDGFDVYAIKSRVHFRRGFDDDGFAKTILLVEPPGPFMGTSKLDALKYENIRVQDFYPFGKNVSLP